MLRDSTADTGEGTWLFPSSRKRRGKLMPLDYHNWLNRVLKPLGDRLGIRVNHQILRRTFAALATIRAAISRTSKRRCAMPA